MARKSRDLELTLEPAPQPTPAAASTPAASPAAAAPPLELVNQSGRTRRVHFDGIAVPEPQPEPAPKQAPTPARSPASLRDTRGGYVGPGYQESYSFSSSTRSAPGGESGYSSSSYASYSSSGSSFGGVRNTLYRTDQGGEVVAYERDGRRTFGLADRTPDGRLVERPFESRVVDKLVEGVDLQQTETVQETVTEYVEETQVIREPVSVPPTEEAPKRRGWFGRRHKAGEDSGETYKPVEPVSELVEEPALAEESVEVAASAGQATHGDAWDHESGLSSSTLLSTSTTASSASAATGKPARSNYTDYSGDTHPVLEIEGIGPTLAARLAAAGVFTTARLCYEDADELAARVEVEPNQVRQWQAMAQLLKVKGIGKQGAEVLARCGVTGIDDLKARDPKALAERIELFIASHKDVTGQAIGAKRLQSWQQAAKRLRKVRQAVPTN